ncbi:MAG TPA: XRE family transcriptional regulator [Alphaproteobacteria bacterium]|jgi:Zn-dependent peptidase ImmA (M78 family)/DNA-binding XRE family transcriptional regulator|nr:XRE family transcriptional regulator [Alphaproteobacteria bacterium]HJM52368.1 XRE family transcriptional regulator [Alphaproteobacteria bacterium]|tara:strand:+ start:624 stop:1718 length:1095 start_codon:yes stop_codon:yes gene_type:complete
MFGDRLKLARKKARYSLRALSEALDNEVTAQAIGKYERGEMMPSSGVLMHMARILGVTLDFLLSDQVEELEGLEFRKLSGTRAKERAGVEAEVIDHLQRYLAIEEILDLESSAWRAPRLGNRFLGQEGDGEILAQNLRREWKLGIDPIPNMTSLLEDRGIKVLVIALPGRVSGLTCLVRRPGHDTLVPAIVVNEHVTLERRRLTLAHELAHRLIDESSPVDQEKACHVFAGAFLVPREHLVQEIGERRKALGYRELIQLKRMYRISGAALLVRLKQVGVIDGSTLTYAFQTYARRWRSDEPEPLEGADDRGKRENPQRFERLCFRALAEGLVSPGKTSELLRQPLAVIEKGIKGPAAGDAHRGQ